MSQLKAIETNYAGCHFRSRIEARWAVFFDTLGIKWEYEKEGFDLGALGYYLPDFWLAELDFWVEVKGQEATKEEAEKCSALSILTGKRVLLLDKGIPEGDAAGRLGLSEKFSEDTKMWFPDGGCDFTYAWTMCPACNAVDCTFDGRGAYMKVACNSLCKITPEVKSARPEVFKFSKRYNANDPRLLAAYAAARSARFEHGQSGPKPPNTAR